MSRIYRQSAEGILKDLLEGAVLETGGCIKAGVRHGHDVLLIDGRVAYTRPRPRRAVGERRPPIQIDRPQKSA